MTVPDRRPIASRDSNWARRAASTLAARGVTPNAVSGAGLVFGVVAGAFLAGTLVLPARIFWILAAACVQMRLICNLLDGMVADVHKRNGRRDKLSPVGDLWNEVPDRFADASVLIGAGYALGGNVESGYVAACVALLTAYVRAVGAASGAPNDFCGPMAKPQRMAVVTVACVLNALLPASWWAVPQSIEYIQPIGLMTLVLWLVIAGGAWTVARRLKRIASALRSSRTT